MGSLQQVSETVLHPQSPQHRHESAKAHSRISTLDFLQCRQREHASCGGRPPRSSAKFIVRLQQNSTDACNPPQSNRGYRMPPLPFTETYSKMPYHGNTPENYREQIFSGSGYRSSPDKRARVAPADRRRIVRATASDNRARSALYRSWCTRGNHTSNQPAGGSV